MTSKKILFVTGCRSDFATIKGVLLSLKKAISIETEIIVTGPHTLKATGLSSQEIVKLGYKISQTQIIHGNDISEDYILEVRGINSYLTENYIDAAVICGDRPEMLAAATALFLKQVPIFHIHGGDITNGGSLDDNIRHAITKLSSIHFVATSLSANIVKRLGEEKWRVFKTGSPDVDELAEFSDQDEKNVLKEFELEPRSFNILLFHPETLAGKMNFDYAKLIILALEKVEGKTVIISPNNDLYSDYIRRAYKDCPKNKYLFFSSLDREKYLTLLKNCEFLIGNSSSGIIEAATFKIPVINLGHRQDGRQRSNNVIDIPNISISNILVALRKNRSNDFHKQMKLTRNVYGTGKSSEKIAELIIMILEKYSWTDLIHKKFKV